MTSFNINHLPFYGYLLLYISTELKTSKEIKNLYESSLLDNDLINYIIFEILIERFSLSRVYHLRDINGPTKNLCIKSAASHISAEMEEKCKCVLSSQRWCCRK